jgi:two-component sensor histidine kinase
MRLVLALRDLRRRPWLGLIASLGVLALAFLLRYALGEKLQDVPFITLFPAILIAALIGGLWVGILVTLLSGVAAWYWFIPPVESFALPTEGMIVFALFILTSAIQLYVIRTLNLAVDQFTAERDRANAMFQELQHRVANNMQFVSTLLRLEAQAARADPEAAQKAMQNAQTRLDSMARIHRRLYDPEAARMPLSEYFKDLCGDILDATGMRNVVCVVEVPPVAFDLRYRVTLSLLLNEIITNSIKHAFAPRSRGTIAIKLDREGGDYALTVKDDGCGLPAGIDFSKSKSIGFRVMQSLAAQLGGKISCSGKEGTTTRVVFPAAA